MEYSEYSNIPATQTLCISAGGHASSGTVTLPACEGVVLLDIVGQKIAGPAVILSTSPVYVVGPAGKAKELLAAVKIAE